MTICFFGQGHLASTNTVIHLKKCHVTGEIFLLSVSVPSLAVLYALWFTVV